jgi:hypothetical protein
VRFSQTKSSGTRKTVRSSRRAMATREGKGFSSMSLPEALNRAVFFRKMRPLLPVARAWAKRSSKGPRCLVLRNGRVNQGRRLTTARMSGSPRRTLAQAR